MSRKSSKQKAAAENFGWLRWDWDVREIKRWWVAYRESTLFSGLNYYRQQAAWFTAAAFAQCVPAYGTALDMEISAPLVRRMREVCERNIYADDRGEIASRLVDWFDWLAFFHKIAHPDKKVMNTLYSLRQDLAVSMGDPANAGTTKRLVMALVKRREKKKNQGQKLYI